MVQKAVRSEASSPNSLGPKRNWPEVHGEECRPRTVLSWLLAKWSWARVRKQGVAHCCPMDLRTRRKRKLLFLEKVGTAGPWTSGRTETEDSPPGPPPGEGVALFSPSPEKEQIPTPGCPHQGHFVDFLDDFGPGWDAGGAALLREARRAGLGMDSAWGGAALEDAGGRPRRWVDWGLAPGAAVDGASRRGRCAGSPRSAAVLPRTAGQSPRRCRRTALPGRWGRRESVPCRSPSSLPGWARDGAPGPPWWTSPSRGTVLRLSSLVEWSQSPCAAPALTPGRYYPRAPVWAPWLGEPAG